MAFGGMMISPGKAFSNGIKETWQSKKLFFLFYAVNLLVAYVMTLPVSMLLTKALSDTVAADVLLQSFSFSVFFNVIRDFGKGIILSQVFLTFGILYLILNIYFAGGIIRIFYLKSEFSFSEFIKGCGEYFSRFFRLFLYFVLVLFGLVVFYGITIVVSKSFTANAANETRTFILFFIRSGLLIIFLGFFNMVFDYAKIITVVNNQFQMREAIRRALKFVFSAPGKTIGLYTLFIATIAFTIVIYFFVEDMFSVQGPVGLFFFFLMTQLTIIARLFFRLAFFAGQLAFYNHTMTAG